MKITNGDPIRSHIKPENVEKLGLRGFIEGAKSSRPDKGRQAEDIVEISSTAREISKLREIARTMPEERAEKVEQIRQMVQNGTYKIEPEKIAERMIQHAIDLLA